MLKQFEIINQKGKNKTLRGGTLIITQEVVLVGNENQKRKGGLKTLKTQNYNSLGPFSNGKIVCLRRP